MTSPVPSSKSEITLTLAGGQARVPPPVPPLPPAPPVPPAPAPPPEPALPPAPVFTQAPFVHVWLAVHVTPQAPQLAVLELVSTQLAGEPQSS